MKNILYDASKIDRKNLMFDNKMLRALLIPIIIEQVLNSFMSENFWMKFSYNQAF